MKDLKKDLKKMFTDNFDVKLTKEELKSVLEENFDLTGIVLYKDTRKIQTVKYLLPTCSVESIKIID
jgi:regulator of replication initiation timing